MPPRAAPAETRQQLLRAAFAECYRHGFQGARIEAVTRAAGATKGALFHHFADKRALGLAVVDEVVAPLLVARWLEPLDGVDDPIPVLQACFRRWVAADVASGHWVQGCPMNNLAQEMSPLDEGFRGRLDALYARWRSEVAAALRRGQRAGTVRPDVDPDGSATLVVLAQQGIWGTGKVSQDPALMTRAAEALCGYLDTLRPVAG